jgi:hypothetical protein
MIMELLQTPNRCRYELLIGTEVDRDHQPIPAAVRECAVDTLKRAVAARFGGYSSHEIAGGWIGADGKLAQERSLCLSVLTDTPDAEAVPRLSEIIAMAKALLRQESVGLTRTELRFSFV